MQGAPGEAHEPPSAQEDRGTAGAPPSTADLPQDEPEREGGNDERSTDNESTNGSSADDSSGRDDYSDAESDGGVRYKRIQHGWEELEADERNDDSRSDNSDSQSDDEEEADGQLDPRTVLIYSLNYLADQFKIVEQYIIQFQNQCSIGMWALTRGIEFPSPFKAQTDETGKQLEERIQPFIRWKNGTINRHHNPQH